MLYTPFLPTRLNAIYRGDRPSSDVPFLAATRGRSLADDLQQLIRPIKEANDIVDVVGAYVSLQPAGQSSKGLCPFHDDRNPSLDVDPRRQRFRCWACGKNGDVITFIQEFDRVDFWEAVELLARRAGISLEKSGKFQANSGRAGMLEVVAWAQRQFHECLLDSPHADAARTYLSERRLTGETIRHFGLGYAPVDGAWLTAGAREGGLALDVLEQVGLITARKEGNGFFDSFRDRIMFPINDVSGRPVGFGGRILPSSPFAQRGPKYKNTKETPLFNKSHLLYGLDRARQAGREDGALAVVEGYTDVLMAHQCGVANVVATMGTALNDKHVRQLRRQAERVVLVFDADTGGSTGVDRALAVFVNQDVRLRIAALPEGLDPCDLLLQQGAETFREILSTAQDVLDFKLDRVTRGLDRGDVEGQRRSVDELLRIIAMGPKLARQADQVKRELLVTQIAQRFGVREETLWARFRELQKDQQRDGAPAASDENAGNSEERRAAPAKAHERELLEVLLAEPNLVAETAAHVSPTDLQHPGLRSLLAELYRLCAAEVVPTLDALRARIDNAPLIAKAFELQERGLANPDRAGWLQEIKAEFCRIGDQKTNHELQQKLQSAGDAQTATELLRRLQEQKDS